MEIRVFCFYYLFNICGDYKERIIFQFECSGAKLDIELEDKQLSFGQVLLYRKNSVICFIRNRSPIKIFWQLHPDGTLDPQISFTPANGVVKEWSDGEIKFCYHASKVKVQI
jgi:hypothetical protein